MNDRHFFLFKEIRTDKVLEPLIRWIDTEPDRRDGCTELFGNGIAGLIAMASEYGYTGDLWHMAITHVLVSSENSYSMACEMRGEKQQTLRSLALMDMELIRDYFNADFVSMASDRDRDAFMLLREYHAGDSDNGVINRRVRDRISDLAKAFEQAPDAAAMLDALDRFYAEYGVGKFGLHKAFRIQSSEEGAKILPIRRIAHVSLDDLIGYENAKRKLIENTEAFVEGRPANNCLLFGEAGTGKSSSIKALANMYFDRGLRIIEVYRHQFRDLNDVISQIKGRNYRFILYMDDLSFEDFETEYKYLKAVIEGGLEKRPGNVLIYATSNRRHLVRESFSDREGAALSDKHGGDTTQEKLSLAARFGISIYFEAPNHEEYQQIVAALAKRNGIDMDPEELRQQAARWELQHGGTSGRGAQQFIDHLLGRKEETGNG